MKRLAFGLGILTVSCVAPPALADFAVAHFSSGYCRVWTETASNPVDGHFVMFRLHQQQFDRFHTRQPAEGALQWAVSRQVCRTK